MSCLKLECWSLMLSSLPGHPQQNFFLKHHDILDASYIVIKINSMPVFMPMQVTIAMTETFGEEIEMSFMMGRSHCILRVNL